MNYVYRTSLGRQARIKAGRSAFYANIERDESNSWENPYTLASPAWYDWWEGWRVAHNEFTHPDFHIPETQGTPT